MIFDNLNQYFSDDVIKVWLGNKRNSKTLEWYNPYQQNQTFDLDIRQGPGQNCLYMFGKIALPQGCSDNFPCGICKLPENEVLYLKGLCKDDRHIFYDVQYYVHGVKNDRPYFR